MERLHSISWRLGWGQSVWGPHSESTGFSKAFTKRRAVCFACWVPELLFCYEPENAATSPHLCSILRRPELSLAGHFASAFAHRCCWLQPPHTPGRRCFRKGTIWLVGPGHVTFPCCLGSQLANMSNDVPMMAYFFFSFPALDYCR